MSRVTQKGQVLIPRDIRRRMGIREGVSNVRWELFQGRACIVVENPDDRFQRALGIAKGKGVGMGTDEIMEITRGDR